jgi:hypothetical protein
VLLVVPVERVEPVEPVLLVVLVDMVEPVLFVELVEPVEPVLYVEAVDMVEPVDPSVDPLESGHVLEVVVSEPVVVIVAGVRVSARIAIEEAMHTDKKIVFFILLSFKIILHNAKTSYHLQRLKVRKIFPCDNYFFSVKQKKVPVFTDRDSF